MISGNRVRVRPIEVADQSFLTQLNGDPVVRRRVVGWDFPKSLFEQEQWFRAGSPGSTQRWVVENFDGESIGMTGLWGIDWRNRNAETALKLGGSQQVRGRGYGRDAIRLISAFAFYDAGLDRLYSTVLADNIASLKAYCEHGGWEREGVARKHVLRNGSYVDLIHIGQLREDYEKQPFAEEYRQFVCS